MYKHLLVTLATGAALALAAPTFAATSGTSTAQTIETGAAPTTLIAENNMPMNGMSMQGSQHHGSQRHDMRHRHHRMHNWPFAEALKKLDLTEDQKTAIRAKLKSAESTIHASMKNLRAERSAFYTTVPGSPEYIPTYEKYAHDAAAAVQTRIQQIATAHTNIFNLLTADQQKQLKAELADQAQAAHEHWKKNWKNNQH